MYLDRQLKREGVALDQDYRARKKAWKRSL